MSDSESNTTCPVCRETPKAEILEAQGYVLAAASALYNHDDANLIADCANNSGPLDFHVAVTMMVSYMEGLSLLAGIAVPTLLDRLRSDLTEKQAHAATEE